MNAEKTLVNLDADERILLEVRRHMFIFYMRIAFVVFLFFLPLALSPLIIGTLERFLSGSAGALFGFFLMMWFLILWVIFFLQWTDYFLDVWIITNKRIFDIEQRGMFDREISVFRLEQVQDITVEVRGIIPTLLKFGTIHIHTAGESQDFAIRDAAEPLFVKNTIMDAHGKALEASVHRPA